MQPHHDVRLVQHLAVIALRRDAQQRAEAVRYAIQPLFESGLGAARIAMELNKRRISPPGAASGHGGTTWAKITVQRALKRLGLKRQ